MNKYERLTKRFTGGSPYTEYASGQDILERLAELEDKIENGTLSEFPCRVGGRVYKIMKVAGVERIAEYVVMDFSCGIHGNFIKAHSMQGNDKTITFGEFRDGWFLTKAEAEKKLKELQDER